MDPVTYTVHIQPCSGDLLVFCIPFIFLALIACFDPNAPEHDD